MKKSSLVISILCISISLSSSTLCKSSSKLNEGRTDIFNVHELFDYYSESINHNEYELSCSNTERIKNISFLNDGQTITTNVDMKYNRDTDILSITVNQYDKNNFFQTDYQKILKPIFVYDDEEMNLKIEYNNKLFDLEEYVYLAKTKNLENVSGLIAVDDLAVLTIAALILSLSVVLSANVEIVSSQNDFSSNSNTTWASILLFIVFPFSLLNSEFSARETIFDTSSSYITMSINGMSVVMNSYAEINLLLNALKKLDDNKFYPCIVFPDIGTVFLSSIPIEYNSAMAIMISQYYFQPQDIQCNDIDIKNDLINEAKKQCLSTYTPLESDARHLAYESATLLGSVVPEILYNYEWHKNLPGIQFPHYHPGYKPHVSKAHSLFGNPVIGGK